MLIIYMITHFLVDFVSVLFVLGKLPALATSAEAFAFSIVVYNFFAFFFQVPLGLLLDRLKVYKYIGIIGFALIGICYLISGDIFILASLVGLGNALFHLEGGVNAYRLSNQKAFFNGLFVAPGALGVFLGTTFAPSLSSTSLPIILIFLAIILLGFVRDEKLNEPKTKQVPLRFSKLNYFLIFALVGVSIIVRSIGGGALDYSWKSDFLFGLIFALSTVFGKAFGGLLADKFGFAKTASLSLIFATIFLILGFDYPLFGFLGIFCFNIPMSITLTLLENSSQKTATAVGANTAFLFIGFLICLLKFTTNNVTLLVLTTALAIISIYFANKIYNKERKQNER